MAETSETKTETPKRGRRLCATCGERVRAGGDPEQIGKAADNCVQCNINLLDDGKCPVCGSGLKTKKHTDHVQAAA